MKKNLFILLLLTFFSNNLFSQRSDSTLKVNQNGDSSYLVHLNIPKCKFIGNSWYISLSYNYCKTNEFDFDFGRTYGYFSNVLHEDGVHTRTWGAGYGLTSKKGESTQLFRIFWEFNYFYEMGGSLGGGRIEFIHDIKNNTNYLRPSLGLSFIIFDIFYNYSINLNKDKTNIFKHGVTIRINYFYKEKNWHKYIERKLK